MRQDVTYCAVDAGWAQSPTTKKPTKSLSVVAVTSSMTKVRGRWIVGTTAAVDTSCRGVTLP